MPTWRNWIKTENTKIEDTKYMCEFTKYRKNLDIKPYTISNFAKKIKFEGSILEFLN